MSKIKIALCFLTVCFCLANQSVQADPESLFWPSAATFPLGDSAGGPLTSADFNNDGHDDFADGNTYDGKISIMLGDGKGYFALSGTPVQSPAYDLSGLASGDLNGDGNIDLVLTSSSYSRFDILLGNGQGGFTPASTTNVPSASLTRIAVADFNNDNNLDVVASGNSAFHLFLGNGQGGFAASVSFPIPAGVSNLVAADINGDGRPDVITIDQTSISVFLNNGTGGFGNPIASSHGFSYSFSTKTITGDFNCDGALDVVVLRGGFPFSVLFGNGIGGFGTPSIYTTSIPIQSITLGDVNRDGEMDLVAVSNSGSNSPGEIVIYVGNMSGVFTLFDTLSVGNVSDNVIIKDVTGDRNVDLIFSQRSLNYNGFLNVLRGNGIGNFTSYLPFDLTPTGAPLFDVLSADFNGDSLNDFAVTRFVTSSYVSIYLNNGSGQFSAPIDINIPGVLSSLMAADDFNRDGKMDLAVGSPSSNPASVTILIGNGNGTFVIGSAFTVGNGPSSIKSADFNNDQNPDLLVQYTLGWSSVIAVYLGNGQGAFVSAGNYNFLSTIEDVVIADFNQDGNKDWAVTNSYARTVLIYLGNGQGGFTNMPNSFIFNNIRGIAADDVNNDGVMDLVIGYQRPIATRTQFEQVTILLGNNNGTFTPGNIYDVGERPQTVVIRDFDNDGIKDIIVLNRYSYNISILLGIGGGNFRPARYFSTVREVSRMIAADIDNNGKIDLLTINGLGSLGFLLNNVSNVYANLSTNFNQLPPGGTLSNILKLNNVTAQPQTFHLLLVTVLPNNTVRPELFLPNLTMSPNQALSVNYQWNIPAGTSLGAYSQQVWTGTSLNDIWDVGSLDYEVKYPVYCPDL